MIDQQLTPGRWLLAKQRCTRPQQRFAEQARITFDASCDTMAACEASASIQSLMSW
jgi:hypothetical protein